MLCFIGTAENPNVGIVINSLFGLESWSVIGVLVVLIHKKLTPLVCNTFGYRYSKYKMRKCSLTRL